jgi:hypothetical protein
MSNIIHAVVRPRVRGFFKLRAHKLDGSSRDLTDWFPNLITDAGLNRIGNGDYVVACHVGTNNAAPANGDTALGGFVAGTATVTNTSNGAQSSEPYYGWKRWTFRFGIGEAAGNLSEIGIATARTNGGSTIMFSRALILDEFGDPTTITIGADEILDATYELRLYPPLTDDERTITITGSGDHDTVTRASQVTGVNTWSVRLGLRGSFSTANPITAYNGTLGAITSTPSGSSGVSANTFDYAYDNNSLLRNGGGSFTLSQGNLSGGITATRWITSLGTYQTSYDPPIDKTLTKTLVLNYRVQWARA